jgi:hypothetical protein
MILPELEKTAGEAKRLSTKCKQGHKSLIERVIE